MWVRARTCACENVCVCVVYLRWADHLFSLLPLFCGFALFRRAELPAALQQQQPNQQLQSRSHRGVWTHTHKHTCINDKKKKNAKVLAEESSRVVSVKLPKGTKITMAGKQRSETSEHRPSTFPTRTFHMLFLNKTVWLDATCLLEEEREEEKKTLSIAVEKFA